MIEAVAGSLVYGPRGMPHAFRVDSVEARLLLFFRPAGVEGFFREAGKVARSLGLPPADEQFLDREGLMEVAMTFGHAPGAPAIGLRPEVRQHIERVEHRHRYRPTSRSAADSGAVVGDGAAVSVSRCRRARCSSSLATSAVQPV